MPVVEGGWRRPGLGLLTAALLGSAFAVVPDYASAASSFWGADPRPALVPPPMHRKRPKVPRVNEQAEKNKPEGPLILAISIQHQHLKVFDANGLYAEAPVSTGQPGHLTPMGVFSVIEKQRWHRSNIYSGAPMPYMQRITWSGVAMHEGVLPGYPASHGCIRMPGSFAVKLWGWTKRGARVIIVPGEISIEEFSHPKLVAHMIDETKPSASLVPTTSGALEMPATVGNADDDKPELKLTTLADASGSSLPLTKTDESAKPEAVSDGKVEATKDPPPTQPTEQANVTETQSTETAAAQKVEETSEQAIEHTIDQAAALVEVAPVQLDGQAGDTSHTIETTATASPKPVTEQVQATAPATELPNSESTSSGAAKSEPAKTEAAKIETPKSATPVERTSATTPAQATAAPSEVAASPAYDANDPPTVIGPKRTGHIAVFISRKDRRLYVRQNFSPVFDVPVTITDPDKPFGTFVFTARGDKNDATALHWSVVAMPYATRKTIALAAPRPGKKAKQIVETALSTPPSTAVEALDRISVPEWVTQRIAESIKPGGSLIISDHGLGDETGEGTDFIVPLR
jgi:hypothetical protein